jgi:hypothetical protein
VTQAASKGHTNLIGLFFFDLDLDSACTTNMIPLTITAGELNLASEKDTNQLSSYPTSLPSSAAILLPQFPGAQSSRPANRRSINKHTIIHG